MTNTTAIQKLTELSKVMSDLKREAIEKGQTLFSEACTEIFAAHPELESFSWTQYAPYFNDGDPCEFSVHTDYLDVRLTVDNHTVQIDSASSGWKGDELYCDSLEVVEYTGPGEGMSDDDFEIHLKGNPGVVVDILNSLYPIMYFLGQNEDVAEQAFGSDCRVVVSRDGVNIEEVSHD